MGYFAAVSLGLLLSFPAFAISVADIPNLVTERNEEVRASEKDREIAEAGIGVARARFFPSITSRSFFIHLGENPTANLPPQTLPIGNIANVSIEFPPLVVEKQDFLTSSLILKAPIFAGGRILAAFRAAKAQSEEATATRNKTVEDKVGESLQRYFGYQLANDSLTILRGLKENLGRLRSISESLVKAGLGAKFSTLQIKVAEADLNSRLIEVEGKRKLADLAFRSSVNQSGDVALTYDSPLKKLPMPTEGDAFKASALKNRPEFSLLNAKRAQADALTTIKTGALLPSLSAIGGYRVASNSSFLTKPTWAVGLVLEIPLTGILTGLPERSQAVLTEEKVEILAERAKLDVPLQVEKIFSEAQSADAAYTANEEGLEMAKEALRLAEVRFKGGDGSAVEILRATTDLEKAQIRKLQLIEEFNRKLIELHGAAGKISGYLEAYGANSL